MSYRSIFCFSNIFFVNKRFRLCLSYLYCKYYQILLMLGRQWMIWKVLVLWITPRMKVRREQIKEEIMIIKLFASNYPRDLSLYIFQIYQITRVYGNVEGREHSQTRSAIPISKGILNNPYFHSDFAVKIHTYETSNLPKR